jgi:hypothetical protein
MVISTPKPVVVAEPAAAAAAAPAGKKVKAVAAKAPKKPRKSAEVAVAPRPKKPRAVPEPITTGNLVVLGTVPLSGAKMFQNIFAETKPHAISMVGRVRQGAEKFCNRPLTGDTSRPPFTFKVDKSSARDALADSFCLKEEGIS